MPDLMSEIIRTLVTTLITTAGGILGAYLIKGKGASEGRDSTQKKRAMSMGALTGLGIGIVVGVTLAIFWPTGDPCLRAKISAPQGVKDRAHAATRMVEYEIPISWTAPNREACAMIIHSYQKSNPDPIRNTIKPVVPGTILDIGDPGSGETQIKIWVDGSPIESDDIWVWIK